MSFCRTLHMECKNVIENDGKEVVEIVNIKQSHDIEYYVGSSIQYKSNSSFLFVNSN